MTVDERKQFINNYLEQLEEEIETLKERISEFKKKLENVQTHDELDRIMENRQKRLTKQEFIEKAIQNGVDNDSKNVWVFVDGYKYITDIDDELDYNDEEQPYTASYYLETYTVSSVWDDLYEKYCCREGIRYAETTNHSVNRNLNQCLH